VSRRLLRYRELKLEKGIPFSRMHIDRLEKAGKFPRRVRLGLNTVGWFDDELDEHVEKAAAERSAA
jgi:prophage regulatory protein